MASLNVNSLLSKIDDVRLPAKNKCIDILTINQRQNHTKIDDQLIAINNFYLTRHDRNKQRGGVALYQVSQKSIGI